MSETPARNEAFEHSGFFVLRTPLLPFDEYAEWSRDLEAATRRDRRRLLSRLAERVGESRLAEALYLASPSLHERSRGWHPDRSDQKSLGIARALVRYFVRSATRATPFGLFAGCSTGRVGATTRLEIAPRETYARRSRLDTHYMSLLCDALTNDPTVRARIELRPNTSLYRTGGRLRYAESRTTGKARTHHLVAVDDTEYLARTLERARDGATRDALSEALVKGETDVTPEEGAEFIDALIDNQILVPETEPTVTGDDPLSCLLETLHRRGLDGEVTEVLGWARGELAELDRRGVGNDPGRYEGLARRLEALPPPVDPARLVQVDMLKPAPEASLGEEVVSEIGRAAEILRSLQRPLRESHMTRFLEAFTARYEGRWMPLEEVIDEEMGIGFAKSQAPQAESSPLLAGLSLPSVREPRVIWGVQERVLLVLLDEALASGSHRITLDDRDLERLRIPDAPPLPDAFAVTASVSASARDALEAGDFEITVRNTYGPSGARMLGRFCDADETLLRAVKGHLRAEEAARPDAVFAEIVHLPEGRIGNVILRPLLRSHEIPFLGRSGAPRDRQIPLSDLLVGVAGGRVVLRSRALGAEIVPCLTNAHNFGGRSLGLYRFLCSIGSQGVTSGASWPWGPLGDAPFLPRVVTGRLVLSRARWRVRRREIEGLLGASGTGIYESAAELRKKRRLPRFVVLADGDNEILVDFENVLSLEVFVDLVKKRLAFDLVEPLSDPERLVVEGPEGRYVNEVIVPFVRDARADQRTSPAAPAGVVSEAPAAPRSFAPGSEWSYVKVYSGTSTADVLLREVVGPVVRALSAERVIDRWHFLRYVDPDPHLRVRLHAPEPRLAREAADRLLEPARRAHREGFIHKIQVDTYDREIERYGGPEAIEHAERYFHADSEAVLTIVENLVGDAGADARWRLALRGMEDLLSDFGFDLAARAEIVHRARDGYGREFLAGTPLRRRLSDRYRGERASIEALLDARGTPDDDFAWGIEAFRNRSTASASAIRAYRELSDRDALVTPLETIVGSMMHMSANRILRSSARAQELVIFDFLARAYRSRIARAKSARARKARAV